LLWVAVFGVPANPSLERFEVYAYETVDFTVGNYDDAPTDTQSPNPSPTVPESSTSPSPILTATSSQSGAELTMNGLNQVETWGLYALLVVVALLLVIALVIKRKALKTLSSQGFLTVFSQGTFTRRL
jgi:hypothetical protein